MAARRRAAPRAKETGGGRLWPPIVGLFVLRVFTGALFLNVFHYKLVATRMKGLGLGLKDALVHFAETDYLPVVEAGIRQPPTIDLFGMHAELGFWSGFLEHVMRPGQMPYIAGPAILFFEGLLGISLVLGLGVRLMAFLGALMMLAFALTRNMYVLTVAEGPNWLLFAVLLCLSLGAAGRVGGLDTRLRRRWPGWIS